MLTNPTPFPKEKIVRSFNRNAFSGTDGTIDEYKWRKNNLVLLRSFNYKETSESNKFIVTIKYYKDKKVIKLETKSINETEIPEYHGLYW